MKRDPVQMSNREFDLLVIGGGIHGACIAWDATLRGLSVALIERGDFGQETSANSLKTVHGGLRYLQDANINRVRMMIHERKSYLRIAPHLVHPMPCLTPTYSSLMKSRMVMDLVLKLNDVAGYDRNRISDPEKFIPPSRILSRQECREVLPGLSAQGLTGGALWYDGQIYDTERLTLSFVLSAAKSGALVGNYIEALGFLKDGAKIFGVKARDVISDELFDIRSQVIVNAAGPWVDYVLEDVQELSGKKKFHHSLAMNIITHKVIDGYAAGVPSWPENKSIGNGDQYVSHMLFVSPWRNHSLIGTFHSHFKGDPDKFKIKEEHLLNNLQEVNSAYPGADLSLEDITFIHHGFLPEKKDASGKDVHLIRQGHVFDHRKNGIEGLITVIGVKYSTARHLAERAVDKVFNMLSQEPPKSVSNCTQLHDGQIDQFEDFLAQATKENSNLIDPMTIDHMVRSYGSEYYRVRDLIDNGVEQPLLGLNSRQVLRGMVLYAIQEEMAIKLSDVILRRTGIGTTGRPEEASLKTCADIMTKEMNWDENKKVAEIDEVGAVYNRLGVGKGI